MGLSHSPHTVTDGLVLCLDAANRRSYPGTGTTWYDLSGNGNHGTLTNGPVFNGGVEGMSFDGTDDYVDFGNILNKTANAEYSMAFWIFPDDATATYPQVIVQKRLTSSPNTGFAVFYDVQNNRKIRILLDDGPTALNVISINGLQVLAWNHVSVIIDNDTVSIYINNILEISDTNAVYSNDLTSTATLQLANDSLAQFNVDNFDGRLDNIHIYNRALSANEVQQNYNATRWRFQ
jgi:hypothetical protein